MTATSAFTVVGTGAVELSRDGRTMVVRIPIKLRHQKGRKQMLMSASRMAVPMKASTPVRIDNTLVKAIVRAHRWRSMLEGGRYNSVRALAAAEKINESYLSRMLRLTLLSPEIIEAILEGNQPPNLELASLLEKLPSDWEAQAAYIAILQ